MKKLAEKVVNKLKKKKLKISFAESCTGGMLASAITSVSGSSKVFTMSFITYSNRAKNNVLKVSKKVIKRHGAVSKQCCLSMVKNLSKISRSNIALSITGIAGPNGSTKEKPVGLVYIGLKKGNIIKIHECFFKNRGRYYIQKAAVKNSLNLILNIIK